jgi:hypothetical protein
MIALSRFLLSLSAAIAALLAVVGALALLALGSAAVIRLVVPNPEVVSAKLDSPVAWAQSLQSVRRAVADEEEAARETNLAIKDWAFACNLVWFDVNQQKVLAVDPDATPMLERLARIQDDLFHNRSKLAGGIERENSKLQTLTMALILIGLATTVCAGLRSDDQTLGSWAGTVRILAVVFPALGTAIAAVMSFYEPHQEILRVRSSLVSLQQLHNEVAALSTEACPKNQEDRNKINEKLALWQVRRIQQAPTIALQIAGREASKEPPRDSGGIPLLRPPNPASGGTKG